MATLADIQTQVSARLLDPNNTAVSLASVTSAINDAVNYWKNNRFFFNERHDTATLTAQDPSFPYPTDFLVPATQDDGFYIEYSGIRYPLSKVSQPYYDARFLSTGFGIPKIYAKIANDNYQCYPIPDRNYTVGRHYLKDYVDLSAGTDTNDFTVKASRLIMLWATANLTAELRQDDKMEAYYRAAAEDEVLNLRNLTDKENASGRLTLYSSLTSFY